MKNICHYLSNKIAMKSQRSFLIAVMGLLFFMSVALLPSTVDAETKSPVTLEYRIKAAFLLNFCKFVTWPETTIEQKKSPIILCILGQDPFGSAINAIAGKKIGGRSLEIRYADELESISPCHLLFVTHSMQDRLDDIIALTKMSPILTVGDMDGFAQRGGIVDFFVSQKKIRFEINLVAAKAATIKISSQMLKLAKITDGTHL